MKLSGEVHPFAARYPMLPEDQLAELAADIAANGLKQPLVIDPDGQLLDGRNRLEACQRIDYPLTDDNLRVLSPEDDPVRFIISANNRRRHMAAGQRAMFDVLAELDKSSSSKLPYGWLKANSKTPHDTDDGRPNYDYMMMAAYIAAHDDKEQVYVSAVCAGGRLDQAYHAVKQKVERAESEAKERAQFANDFPGLATQVENGALTFPQAKAAAAVAEAETAYAERVAGIQDEIRLLAESVGPEIDIEALEAPELDVEITKAVETIKQDSVTGVPTDDTLSRQVAQLERLRQVSVQLEHMREHPPEAMWWAEGHVPAVRGFVGRIVSAAYAIAEEANSFLSDGQIKVVK